MVWATRRKAFRTGEEGGSPESPFLIHDQAVEERKSGPHANSLPGK